MSAVIQSQAIRSKMHDFLDRLLSAMRWVLTREAVPDPREWLEMDPRARFGLMPRDFPACLRLLRELETGRDTLIRVTVTKGTSRRAEALERPEISTVIPILEAFLECANSWIVTHRGDRGKKAERPGSDEELSRDIRQLFALFSTTFDALYENECPIPFDSPEMEAIWRWERRT